MYLILMLFLSAFQNVQESQMISCARITAQHRWRSTAIDCGNDDSSGRADFASNILALSAFSSTLKQILQIKTNFSFINI